MFVTFVPRVSYFATKTTRLNTQTRFSRQKKGKSCPGQWQWNHELPLLPAPMQNLDMGRSSIHPCLGQKYVKHDRVTRAGIEISTEDNSIFSS